MISSWYCDKALFRRFNDVIDYPLPTADEIKSTLIKSLQGFKIDEAISWTEVAQSAAGLNYSEITSACEDAIKDAILSGREIISKLDLRRGVGEEEASR